MKKRTPRQRLPFKVGSCLTILVLLILAACAPQLAEQEAPMVEEPAPAQREPVTLEYWTYDYGRQAAFDATDMVIAEFQKQYPWIKFEFHRTPFEGFTDAMTTAIQTGTAPDLAEMYNPWITLYREMGALAPVTDIVNEIEGDQYSDGWKGVSIQDGEWYAIPMYSFPYTLWYRKDIFDEAGLAPPKTWEDALKVAEQLTVDTNDDGEIDRYGLVLPTNVSGGDNIYPLMFATITNDCYILDENARPIVNIGENGERFVEGLAFVKKLYQWQPEGALDWGTIEARPLFAEGHFAALVTTTSFAYNLAKDHPEMIANMATAPWPYNAENPDAASLNLTGGYGHVILKDAKHAEEARLFLEFWHSNRDMEMLYMTNTVDGWLPLRQDVVEDEAYWNSPKVSKVASVVRGGGEYATQHGHFLGFTLAGPNKWPAIFHARALWGTTFFHLLVDDWTPDKTAEWLQDEMERIQAEE